MKKSLIAAAVLMAVSAQANSESLYLSQYSFLKLQEKVLELEETIKRQARTESWTATGILATKISGQPVHVQAVQWGGFESSDLCWAMVKKYSHTDDFIGEGGTDDQVPTVQWNFDGDCTQTRK